MSDIDPEITDADSFDPMAEASAPAVEAEADLDADEPEVTGFFNPQPDPPGRVAWVNPLDKVAIGSANPGPQQLGSIANVAPGRLVGMCDGSV